MATIQGSLYREQLFQKILNSLHQWPELECSIFCEAHYYGRSPETIANTFHMAVGDVRKILQECEQRLHSSLENFLADSSEDLSPPKSFAGRPIRRQTIKKAHARISSNHPIRHFSRKSA